MFLFNGRRKNELMGRGSCLVRVKRICRVRYNHVRIGRVSHCHTTVNHNHITINHNHITVNHVPCNHTTVNHSHITINHNHTTVNHVPCNHTTVNHNHITINHNHTTINHVPYNLLAPCNNHLHNPAPSNLLPHIITTIKPIYLAQRSLLKRTSNDRAHFPPPPRRRR